MPRILPFILIGFLTYNCSKDQPEGYILEGIIEGESYNDYIFLGTHTDSLRDSAKVIDNRFVFKGGPVKMPRQTWLNLRPGANIEFIMLENSHIKIKVKYRAEGKGNARFNFMEITQVEGSESFLLHRELTDFFKKIKKRTIYQPKISNG